MMTMGAFTGKLSGRGLGFIHATRGCAEHCKVTAENDIKTIFRPNAHCARSKKIADSVLVEDPAMVAGM